MTTIITYGTFDLFHIGHLSLLERLKRMGDKLIVAVSTDEFNSKKGKRSFMPFEHRSQIVSAIRCVDLVIAEHDWAQKSKDIRDYEVDILGMGSDWAGKFDDLSHLCDIRYLPRTEGISSTQLRQLGRTFDGSLLKTLQDAQTTISMLIRDFDGAA